MKWHRGTYQLTQHKNTVGIVAHALHLHKELCLHPLGCIVLA